MEKLEPFFARVYAVVARVPRGCAVAYGQIARMLGSPGAARQVGWAMRHCPDALPWHRVVLADGSVAGGEMAALRRALLAAEGVPFLPDGRVNLALCRWDGAPEPVRCAWCLSNPTLTRYHDAEWGRPLREDRKQFEFLTLEVMQCGLSWNLMLQKREIFRRCFAQFDYDRVAAFTEADLEAALATEGMIRSRRKAEAVRGNARCFQRVRAEFGTFCDYLWAFTDGRTIRYDRGNAPLPARNGLSDRVAADLRRRGFTYLGSITVYAHLQACGMVNDHAEDCFRFAGEPGDAPALHCPPEDES